MKAVGFSFTSSRTPGWFHKYFCRTGWSFRNCLLSSNEGSLRTCSAISRWLSRNSSKLASSFRVISLPGADRLSCGLGADEDCAPANVPAMKNTERPEVTGHFLKCARIVFIRNPPLGENWPPVYWCNPLAEQAKKFCNFPRFKDLRQG